MKASEKLISLQICMSRTCVALCIIVVVAYTSPLKELV